MLNRRSFLTVGAGLAGAAVAGQFPASSAFGNAPFADYPFTLGIASGDPLPDGVILWTRLAPDPLNGGGMPPRQFPVQWKVCNDEAMTDVVAEGTVLARPESGHSVHVDVRGLRPERWYHYQFRAGSELSPVGRTRTAPAAGTVPNRLAFATASCQNRPLGFYAAYRDMAAQDLDFVVFLGDYIYENGGGSKIGRGHLPKRFCHTVDDYRTRYAQYKMDPHLQLAHQAFPWLVTIDDHDVLNNWTDMDTDPDMPPEQWIERRSNAFQVFYEHQPVRLAAPPQGPDMLLYRRFQFGELATFSVLDTRQYRSDQACGGGGVPRCDEAYDPARTMTGPEQERWLLDGLDASTTRWNMIAQQVLMAQFDYALGPGEEFAMDASWDGYVAARQRILDFLDQRRPANPVVLTGDIHATFINDLKVDFYDPDSDTVGTELVTTSIASSRSAASNREITAVLPENPHVRYFKGDQRGYTKCTLSPEQLRTDLMYVDEVTDPDSPVRKVASFVVENGRPGAQRDT